MSQFFLRNLPVRVFQSLESFEDLISVWGFCHSTNDDILEFLEGHGSCLLRVCRL